MAIEPPRTLEDVEQVREASASKLVMASDDRIYSYC